VLAREAVSDDAGQPRAPQSGNREAVLSGVGGRWVWVGPAGVDGRGLVSELAGVSIRIDISYDGVKPGLGAATIMGRGKLDKKERWLSN